jgi:hypothetical protein
MIETGDKICFARAYAHQGELLGRKLGITDAGAKRLMKEEFQAAEQADFYEWGKDLEEKFYRPQVEAERQRAASRQRGAEREADFERSRGPARTGSASAGDDSAPPRTRKRTSSRARMTLDR